MAEGFLQQFDDHEAFSAGTKPGAAVHPKAIVVMQEVCIDISANKPKSVEQFLKEEFDYVITVCDSALKNCPIFKGKVKKLLHIKL